MRCLYKINSILFLLFLVSCSEEKIGEQSEYGTVTGKVVFADTFEPMENVKVLSSPTTSTVFTDAEGKFTISNVKIGEYSFQAQKEGYVSKFEAVTINTNSTSEVVFELKKIITDNKPPTAPVLVTPTDNSSGQAVSLDLIWTATDPDNDELTFKVTVRNDSNAEVKTYDAIKEKKLTLSNLIYGAKYYWQVEVDDGVNTPILSTVSSFSTLTFPLARYLFVKEINNNNVIFTADDAGKQYQLTSSDKNSWRPRRNNQAKKIAYIATNGSKNDIYMMNFDGTGVKKITSSVPIAGFNSDYIGYSWNASGSALIYPNFDKLYKINNDGSGLTKIFQTPNGKFISECDWSADELKIVLKVNDANGYNVEIYVINISGNVIANVVSGQPGAFGGLNFSITGQKIVYSWDITGYENANYRQLDSRIFEYNFATGTSAQILLDKTVGTNDLDVRYSPNEAEVIFINTSNDGISERKIYKALVKNTNENTRTLLFSGTSMPDWE